MPAEGRGPCRIRIHERGNARDAARLESLERAAVEALDDRATADDHEIERHAAYRYKSSPTARDSQGCPCRITAASACSIIGRFPARARAAVEL